MRLKALFAFLAVGAMVATAQVSALWSFKQGTATAVTAEISAEDVFSSSSWALGSNLYISGIRNQTSPTMPNGLMNNLHPYEGTGSGTTACTPANACTFTLVPKKGVTFTPATLEFNSCKVGTSGGTWYIDIVADGVTTNVASAFNPARYDYSVCSYDLSGISASQRLEVVFYVTNLANNKEITLGDVKISGTYSGSAIAVPVYTLDAETSDAAAGSVSVVPSGSEFDEGTEITLTASENFGYHFDSWRDAEGKVVSTENPYTFAIAANTVLRAHYTSTPVYTLKVNLEGGANPNLVQFAPAGHVVDGIHHYEEGTEVVLTTLNNRILTFTNWEDNNTSTSREIVVNADTEVTANFSCEDFIVGWDFYNDDPASERAADYRADSENAGLLSMRNAEGNTWGWLAGGVNKGMQRGRYCARVWRPFSAGYYFEISFSTKGYTDIVLSAILGNDFASYTVYDVEYSVDGENFTKFAEYTLPNRGWTEGENALPAEANDQARVWIRFMADKSSGFIGSGAETADGNTTDGFSIADVYVLANSSAASDDVAPVLVNSIPAVNDTNVPANGQIVLTFDEKIVLVDGAKATLAGETLTGIATGKTVTFKYNGLQYNTGYIFYLPAGAITDRNGNAYQGLSLKFTTMERQQPALRVYDAVVDINGNGDYTSLQEAIDNAPAGLGKPWLIFVKKGRYNEHIDIPASKPFIHIIGQERDNTVIYDDRLSGGETAVHVSLGATVVVHSNDCFFENITLENSYGHELQNGPQALALNTEGDRTIFNNVAMLSYQDTWITPSASNNRAYVYNSLIEGAVDFIYNSGNIFIDQTILYITRKSGGYIVAPSHGLDVDWGYVFTNCTITAPGVPSETSVWLGRPWHNYPKTVFINTRAEVTIPATGWYETMGGLPVLWAEYNTMDGNGNLVDLSQRRDTYYRMEDGQKVYGKAKNTLTDAEAAEYTVKNVLSGSDAWQPTLKTEACEAPIVKFYHDMSRIEWVEVPYAICYVVTVDGVVEAITTECYHNIDFDPAKRYQVQAVNEFGGLSRVADAYGTTSVDGINAEVTDEAPVWYDMQGRRIADPAGRPGLYLRHTATGTEKVLVK